ncbi:hypothetical protein D3C86_1454570 [compost metagenome]
MLWRHPDAIILEDDNQIIVLRPRIQPNVVILLDPIGEAVLENIFDERLQRQTCRLLQEKFRWNSDVELELPPNPVLHNRHVVQHMFELIDDRRFFNMCLHGVAEHGSYRIHNLGNFSGLLNNGVDDNIFQRIVQEMRINLQLQRLQLGLLSLQFSVLLAELCSIQGVH